MSVRVRYVKKTPQNLAIINYLDRMCFPSDDPFDVCENTLMWLGFDSGIPVCYGTLKYVDGGMWFLSRAGVLDQYRGRGLHKRMITARIKAAKKIGGEELVTYTNNHNSASLTNLFACGFKPYTPETPWGGEKAVHLILDIRKPTLKIVVDTPEE